MWDASNWNQNQADFMSIEYLAPDLSSSQYNQRNFFGIYSYTHIGFALTHIAAGNSSFDRKKKNIYIYIYYDSNLMLSEFLIGKIFTVHYAQKKTGQYHNIFHDETESKLSCQSSRDPYKHIILIRMSFILLLSWTHFHTTSGTPAPSFATPTWQHL